MKRELRSLDEWLAHQTTQHPKSIALGLERLSIVASKLALKPPARHVLTVAGTNGKGSTVAFAEAMARAAGYRVGAYTSPHLLRYNERLRIDGVDIDDQPLVAAFERIEAAREGLPLTYFEFGTLAALLIFAEARLDLAVLEVGLGGRLDAVNLVDPQVAVVTTVALDHQDYLGNGREQIGREKAGIFRPGTPAVIGELDPPASTIEHAQQIGARLKRCGHEFHIEPFAEGCWRYREGAYTLELPKLALPGLHQFGNAATAIAALRELGHSLPISDDAMLAGAAAATVRGRLQRVAQAPEIILDVAHNPQAAVELARWLDHQPNSGRSIAVFAALGDKDLVGIVAPLCARLQRWHLAGLHDAPGRALTGATLAERLAGSLTADRVQVHFDVATALAAARAEAGPGDRIVVFGSFHTVADALARISHKTP